MTTYTRTFARRAPCTICGHECRSHSGVCRACRRSASDLTALAAWTCGDATVTALAQQAGVSRQMFHRRLRRALRGEA